MTTGKDKKKTSEELKAERIHKKIMQKCGMMAEVIEYRKSTDIDIKFEDGAVRSHVSYARFEQGTLRHPSQLSAALAEKRMNETRTMSNGQKATIIKHRSSDNIDIQFEDGTIREHVKYVHFEAGKVSPIHRKKNDQSRVGKILTMKNGLMAKIIKYRKADDMDIQFEDGVIVRHVRYDHFEDGNIAHPKMKYNNSTSIQEFAIEYYLRNYGFCKIEKGEWKHQGFENYELDFYNEEYNIAIEFDGGFHDKPKPKARDIKKNKKCKEMGIVLYRLRHPSLKTIADQNSINYVLDSSREVCVGIIDCKKELEEILATHNISFGKDDINFVRDKDAIQNEYNDTYLNYYKKKYEGNIVYSNPAQQNMTLIEYRTALDVDVQFEDGAIREHVTHNEFKKGSVQHPSKTNKTIAEQRLNKTLTMKNGMKATVIAYRKTKDIDVRFEDGVVCEHVNYYSFEKGTLQHPNYPQKQALARKRFNEVRIMSNGMSAKLIRYRNSNDIDVKFEDGEIATHKAYASFEKGLIAHPSKTANSLAAQRLNETKVMKCGLMATIIVYRSSSDIDIQFEDGCIVQHKRYEQFNKASIQHPTIRQDLFIKEHLNETRIMNNGMEATIINCSKFHDIDVQFEDGEVRHHISYGNFKKGKVKHPRKTRKQCSVPA